MRNKTTAPKSQTSAAADAATVAGMPAPPGHLQVGRNLRGQAELVAEAERRKATIQKIIEEDSDATDIMFVSGRTDLLRGVVREPGWHYLVVGEDWSRGDKARINFALFAREGYEIAPHPHTPNGKADWPDIGLCIMRVPEARYRRYRRAIRLAVEEANGGVDMLMGGASNKKSQSGPIVYDESINLGMVGPNELGITPSGVVQ